MHDAIMEAFGHEIQEDTKRHNVTSDKFNESVKHLAGANILLVEDNALNQELAIEFLSSHGINVTVAENGLKALNQVKDIDYDGVLMDCQMPVMDGYQATESIRNLSGKYESLPIIAMTANVMSSDREKATKAGMNDHIGKPIRIEEMFETMAKWITPVHPVDFDQEQAGNESLSADEDMIAIEAITMIDSRAGLFNTQNNVKLYKKLLTQFTQSQQSFKDDFFQGFTDKDYGLCERLAHTSKGLIATIGCKILYQPLADLEDACSQSDDAKIEALFTQITPQLTDLIEQLNSLSIQGSSSSMKKEQLSEENFNSLLLELVDSCESFDSNAPDMLEKIMDYEIPEQDLAVLKDAYELLAQYQFDEGLERITQHFKLAS